MKVRRICEDTSDMGMFELAHNHVFVKDGEAWYRDFEREISVRDLMREIHMKHESEVDVCEMDEEELDEYLFDNLQYGTDELEGIFALLYMTMWGMADVREWLKSYEETGSPNTIQPEILRREIDTYGSEEQELIWEQEAKKQAAAAGEMRITLAERLEDIRTRISETRQTLLTEDNHLDQVILQWKLEQLHEQEEWLEAVLYRKR